MSPNGTRSVYSFPVPPARIFSGIPHGPDITQTARMYCLERNPGNDRKYGARAVSVGSNFHLFSARRGDGRLYVMHRDPSNLETSARLLLDIGGGVFATPYGKDGQQVLLIPETTSEQAEAPLYTGAYLLTSNSTVEASVQTFDWLEHNPYGQAKDLDEPATRGVGSVFTTQAKITAPFSEKASAVWGKLLTATLNASHLSVAERGEFHRAFSREYPDSKGWHQLSLQIPSPFSLLPLTSVSVTLIQENGKTGKPITLSTGYHEYTGLHGYTTKPGLTYHSDILKNLSRKDVELTTGYRLQGEMTIKGEKFHFSVVLPRDQVPLNNLPELILAAG